MYVDINESVNKVSKSREMPIFKKKLLRTVLLAIPRLAIFYNVALMLVFAMDWICCNSEIQLYSMTCCFRLSTKRTCPLNLLLMLSRNKCSKYSRTINVPNDL